MGDSESVSRLSVLPGLGRVTPPLGTPSGPVGSTDARGGE